MPDFANLFRDDGETAALLTGAGGLNRGVEREQVRLLGDAGDRRDDLVDLLGLGGELADDVVDGGGGVPHGMHRRVRLLGSGDTLLRDLARHVGDLGCPLRGLGRLGHRAADLEGGLAAAGWASRK